MIRLVATARFNRRRKRLSPDYRKRCDKALERFVENPEYPGLRFEGLAGRPNYYSIRVSKGFRIILKRSEDEHGSLFTAVSVGPHDVYRNL